MDSFTEAPFTPRPPSALYGWPPVDMGKDIEAIVEHEGPIHRDLLIVRVARRFGAQRTGSNIGDIISVQINKAVKAARIVKKGAWFWSKRQSTVRPRRPGPNTSLRNIKHVPPDELEEAAVVVAGISNGILRHDLTREVRHLLGYRRMGPHVDTAVNAAIDRLLKLGRLVERGGFIVAPDFQDPRPRAQRLSPGARGVRRLHATPAVPETPKTGQPLADGQPLPAPRPSENLPAFLRSHGLRVIDLRPAGRLWVAGRPPHPPVFKQLEQLGVHFRHAQQARALDHSPGWWTDWDGDQAPPLVEAVPEPPKPAEPPRPAAEIDTAGVRSRLLKAKNEKIDELPRTNQWRGGVELAAKLKDELKHIDTALERLNDGTYGYCLTCGDWIGDRLAVVPWSNYCIDHLRRTG